jgi:predicted dienelactone hydrolase
VGLNAPGLASAAAEAGSAPDVRVGHAIKSIKVPDAYCAQPLHNESSCPRADVLRSVDVHVWYPADAKKFSDFDQASYKSTLFDQLHQSHPDWLTWKVPSQIARDNAPIDQSGPPFPVIVFSHGSQNDPIDYAPTLERLAGQGFVVAAPYHVNNTQDDIRTDFINKNQNAQLPCRVPWLPLLPSSSPACSRDTVENSLGNGVAFDMADRVNDISAVLDALPGWFPARVDVSRAGILGHSRGTVTALAAAGGSVRWTSTLNCQTQDHNIQDNQDRCWPLSSLNSNPDGDHRVKAVMGLAIGGKLITPAVNLANIDVPTLLVAGEHDENSVWPISEGAFDQIPSQDKAFVSLPNGVHRSFDSNYCAEAQAAGASADGNKDGRVDEGEVGQWTSQRVLDRQTLALIVGISRNNITPTHPSPVSLSGSALQYCPASTFTTPVDITKAVTKVSNDWVPFTCVGSDPMTRRCTHYITCVPDTDTACTATTDMPTMGLDTVEVQQGVTELAATFFGTVLKGVGNDGPHFTRYLAPKWLEKHEPMAGINTVACASSDSDAILPPGQLIDPQLGQQVFCSD